MGYGEPELLGQSGRRPGDRQPRPAGRSAVPWASRFGLEAPTRDDATPRWSRSTTRWRASAGRSRASSGPSGPAWADVDPGDARRASRPTCRTSSPTQERERLIARAEELQPWLQGPFLLGGDLVIGGAWRNDQRWVVLGDALPAGPERRARARRRLQRGLRPLHVQPARRRPRARLRAVRVHRAGALPRVDLPSGVDFQRIGWQELDPASTDVRPRPLPRRALPRARPDGAAGRGCGS